MPDQLETFLSFDDEGQAAFVAEQLNAANIPVRVEKTRKPLDTNYLGATLDQNIHIQLKPADFPAAHAALEDYYDKQIAGLDPEYFVFAFSDQELQEIISKADEWGHLNYRLAVKLLRQRGAPINESILTDLKENRIKELSEPEKASASLLFFGYCFIPFGIIISFLIGHHLFYSKRTLPNGSIIFSYRGVDRNHGNRIMTISGILFLIAAMGLFVMLAMQG